MEKTPARGWVLDQLTLIGHYEAQMSHIDEKLNDIWEKVQFATVDEMDEVQRLTDNMSTLYEIQRDLYAARKEAEAQIFAEFPNADKTYWCLCKHAATEYVIAEENFHARDCSPEAERVMLQAASVLGKTVGLALGFKPYGCLRCLDEAMKGGEDAEAEAPTE